MICTKCGNEYPDTLSECPVCGEKRVPDMHGSAGPAAGAQEAPKMIDASARSAPVGTPEEKRPGGVLPLVMGILAIVVPYAGVVLGILAIIFGNKAKAANVRGTSEYTMAQAGWIMGIVGVCVWGAVLVIGLIAAVFVLNVAGFGLGIAGDVLRRYFHT